MRRSQATIAAAAGGAPALIVANAAHEILFATANARSWLQQFFPVDSSEAILPARICRWLEGTTSATDGGIQARRSGASLVVRKYAPQPSECTALLLELRPDETAAKPAPGTLSRRQSDVLRWVATGKSNKAIGEILKISPKTVGKHVENVFRKLGVTSRIAAANAYTGYAGDRRR